MEREKENICLQEESDGVGSEMKGQRSNAGECRQMSLGSNRKEKVG